MLRITHLAHRKSYLVIFFAPVHMENWPKVNLGKVIICSNLVLSTLPLLSLNYPYLGIFALNCPDLTKCALFTPHRFFFMHLLMEILHFCKIGGDTECRLAANAVVLVAPLVLGGYQISIAKYLRWYLPSSASSKILKRSVK